MHKRLRATVFTERGKRGSFKAGDMRAVGGGCRARLKTLALVCGCDERFLCDCLCARCASLAVDTVCGDCS